MPQTNLSKTILWTCLFFGCPFLSANAFQVPPPVLNNPSGCNLGLPINDVSCDATHEFRVNVATAPGASLGTDVFLKELRLIIAHEWDADLDIYLISPNGKVLELSSDNGSGNDNYGLPGGDCSQYTSFISNSLAGACDAPSIIGADAPFIGEYLPEQNFTLFNDGSSPVGLWTLRVCDDGREHYGTLEFVELVFGAAVCLRPTEVSVVSVDSTSVTLDWLPGSNCDTTVFEIGEAGMFSPGDDFSGGSGISQIVLDSCPPMTLTGLSPSTVYEVYLREKCSGSFSLNSCPLTFSTTCRPPPATLIEDFNTQNLCENVCGTACPVSGTWSNSLLDDFDWLVNDSTNITTVGTGPSDDSPGGGKYLYIESNLALCQGGRTGALVSNCINVVASTDTCDMSFDYLLFGSQVAGLRLEATEDGGENWQAVLSVSGNKGAAWKTKYVDLGPWNGKTVQFRFVGIGGEGMLADIALDNIIFYGSQDLGAPPFVYFKDNDGDGYGGQDIWFATCHERAVPGFVQDSSDCNDNAAFINPGMAEFPCDGIDLNCNGNIDEYSFEPPITFDTSVCNGAPAPFRARAIFGKPIYWFDGPTGGSPVFIGEEYLLDDFPTNFTSVPISITFYAEEVSNDSCRSSQRMPSTVTILPQADIQTTDTPVICAGEEFDLSTIDVIDNNGANGLITYHVGNPPTALNQIDSLVVPVEGVSYFIASTPDGGCTDVVNVEFEILPSPRAEITGSPGICLNSTAVLEGEDVGNGIGDLEFQWNTNETDTFINIASLPVAGASVLYTLEITGENGCSGSDSLRVTTVTSIDSLERITGEVTTCGGSDGSIELTPLNGTPPFTFVWNNGPAMQGDSLLIENLPQGSHSFTITDSSPEQCAFVVPLMTVNGPGAVVVSSEVVPVSCNGGSDGCIRMDVNGDDPQVLWSNGETRDSICGLASGPYSVTITDGECENILDFFVPEPQKINVHISKENPTCAGDADGSVFLDVFGGNPPYGFEWSNGLTTMGINNLAAGTYAVTVTDARGCFQEIPFINVVEPAVVSFDTIEMEQPSCFGFSDGSISIKPKGGTAPYDVDWLSGAMGTTVNNLAVGEHGFSIEDVNGCRLLGSLFLDQPTPISIDIDEQNPPVCKGNSDGNIGIDPTGGTGDYSFLWNYLNSSTEDLDGIPDGVYFVEVSDENGCSSISDSIWIQGPEVMTIEAVIDTAGCVGQFGGICIESINGGTPGYSIRWANPDSSQPCIDELSAGKYTVIITDNNGCQVDSTFELTENQVLSMNIETIEPACAGNADGQIFLNITGGIEPTHVEWSDGNTDNPRNDLATGNYLATAYDAAGCELSSGLVFLGEPDPLEIELLSIDQPICSGDFTGNIEVQVAGGTGSRQILWDNGVAGAETLTGLGEGTYTCKVQDEKGCVKERAFQINWPLPIQTEIDQAITGCNGGVIDSTCLVVSGGLTPYVYDWSNGDSTSCLIGVPTGDYSVTITDAVGCSQEHMSVKVPDDIQVISLEQLPSSDKVCFNDSTGELSVGINGGVLPYQFIWDNGEMGLSDTNIVSLSNLPAGHYQLTVTDAVGCTIATQELSIIGEDELVSEILQVRDVSCFGGIDGSIDMDVSGGFMPYTVVWRNEEGDSIASGEDLDNRFAGDYFIEIKDANDCLATNSVTIRQPERSLSVDSFEIAQPSCFGEMDGQVNIFPGGGTPLYSFEWSNGAVGEDLDGLGEGSYFLTMTDANGCVYQSSAFVIAGPAKPLTLDSFEITGPLCFGEASGSIEVHLSGGTRPYFYDWQVGNDSVLLGRPAGEYFLNVFDANFCPPFDTSFVLPDADELTLELAGENTSPGESNGSATVLPEGGSPPYQYLWDNGETTQTISNLPVGWYGVTVWDANLCETTGGIMVDDITPTKQQTRPVLQYLFFPNPTTGTTTLQLSLSAAQDLELKVFNPIGQLVGHQSEAGFLRGNIQIDLSNQPPGVFYISLQGGGEQWLVAKLVRL
ncbi:MAG TPA: T9SS type A sorting domain-containing protein [Bacteroidetes bacterium]|nr:T9SS type A sorting domain-containing protein [Bacteroidota bacterium]